MEHGVKHAVTRWPQGEEVQLANTPMNPLFDNDGALLYVPNPEGYNIAVVDPATNELVKTYDLVLKPNDMAFLPDGQRAVVSLLGHKTLKQGAVTVLDITSGKATDPIMIGIQPEELVLTPDAARAYVVSTSVWVIDVEANEVDTEIHTPVRCYDAALSPDAKRLYLSALFGDSQIVVVDTEINKVTETIELAGGPCCFAFSRDNRRMFISTVYNNSIQVMDLETGEIGKPAVVGELPSYIALTQAGDRAFICHPAGDFVTVIDTDSLDVVETIKVDLGPCAVAIGTVPS